MFFVGYGVGIVVGSVVGSVIMYVVMLRVAREHGRKIHEAATKELKELRRQMLMPHK